MLIHRPRSRNLRNFLCLPRDLVYFISPVVGMPRAGNGLIGTIRSGHRLHTGEDELTRCATSPAVQAGEG